MVNITLNEVEVTYLLKQRPETKKNGGFQELFVILQERFDYSTSTLTLDNDLTERIVRYKGNYGTGGYQSRLRKIFGRTLLA
ncbi:MAG TPA: hypothetical protein VMW01_15770 [Williamwhitmania sp.]|nr:hypothetical protein [Williamwhitmania sp.]